MADDSNKISAEDNFSYQRQPIINQAVDSGFDSLSEEQLNLLRRDPIEILNQDYIAILPAEEQAEMLNQVSIIPFDSNSSTNLASSMHGYVSVNDEGAVYAVGDNHEFLDGVDRYGSPITSEDISSKSEIFSSDSVINAIITANNNTSNIVANMVASAELVGQLTNTAINENLLDKTAQDLIKSSDALIKNKELDIENGMIDPHHEDFAKLENSIKSFESGEMVYNKIREKLSNLEEPYKYEGDIEGLIEDLKGRVDNLRGINEISIVHSPQNDELTNVTIKTTNVHDKDGKSITLLESEGINQDGDSQTNIEAQLHDGKQSCNIPVEVAESAIIAAKDMSSEIKSHGDSSDIKLDFTTKAPIEHSCPSRS